MMNDSAAAERARERLIQVLSSQRLAVVATGSGCAHLSLVAYVALDEGRRIVFATTRKSRKFDRILAEPRVSLLIDTRVNDAFDFAEAAAVTARGRACELEGQRRDEVAQVYVERHPQLADFIAAPSCAMVGVEVDEYDVVTNFQQVVCLQVQS